MFACRVEVEAFDEVIHDGRKKRLSRRMHRGGLGGSERLGVEL